MNIYADYCQIEIDGENIRITPLERIRNRKIIDASITTSSARNDAGSEYRQLNQ